MNIVIPMAGRGERFRIEGYKNPKPLIEFNNKTMIELALESLNLKGDYIFIVYNYSDDNLNQKLKSILENYSDKIISIDYITDGPASSALLAEKYINNDQPLLITNCDQIMNWNSVNFQNFIETTELDGVVVTYNSETLKNSYVKLNDKGLAIKFAEKEVISKYSLNGIHYWRKGRHFIESAKSMIEKNIRCNGEFYLSLTYNQMIDVGLNVGIFHIDNDNHYAVGTPNDLEYFILNFKKNK
jgi:NDP-sugar pyrophosphorylase family protein